MACQVDIYEEVLESIDSWTLPASVKHKLLRTMLNDLSTMLSAAIGEIHSVAPVKLRRYCVAVADPSGVFLHNFVFLVNDSRNRRIVMLGNHRTGGQEF
jgi:hypothetical protein